MTGQATPAIPGNETGGKSAGYEVIVPEHDTGKAAISGGSPALQLRKIEQAQAAIDDLASHYDEWMSSDFRIMMDAGKVAASSPNRESTERALAAAQDVRGNAQLFGYPAVCAAGDALAIALETVLEMDGPYEALTPFLTATTLAYEKTQGATDQNSVSMQQWLADIKMLALEFREKYEVRKKAESADGGEA